MTDNYVYIWFDLANKVLFTSDSQCNGTAVHILWLATYLLLPRKAKIRLPRFPYCSSRGRLGVDAVMGKEAGSPPREDWNVLNTRAELHGCKIYKYN